MRARKSARDDVSGAAALEFAMISTFLAFLCLAGFDFGRYVVAAQRAEAVSYNLAQVLAQTPEDSSAVDSGDGVVTDSQLQYYQNAAMIIFPEALTDSFTQQIPWTSILVVNMTSIRFKPTPSNCTSNCTYTPYVIWSTGNRPCNTVFTAVADSAPPSATTLPLDLYGPNSQLIVDVTYAFTPTIGANWLPTMSVARTTYMTPRDVTMVESSSASTLAPNCSGVL